MKIEVGQWYRCRDPNSIAHVIGRIFDDTYPCAVVLYVQGELDIVAAYTIDGRYSVDMQDEADLVEHLPDCTCPNWKPQKWRKATVHDAVNGRECRVKCDDCTFESRIQGFKRDATYLYFYIMKPSQSKLWYDSELVEVLDD